MNFATRRSNSWSSFLNFSLVALLASNYNSAYATDGGLCGKTETTIFSCPFTNSEAVAICSAAKKGSEFVEYRYGRQNNVKMRFRADATDPQKKFHRAEVSYASNAAEVIWFQNNGDVYRIHMLARGGPFLDVLRGGEKIARHDCEEGWRHVENSSVTENQFIVDHGNRNDYELAPLWGGK